MGKLSLQARDRPGGGLLFPVDSDHLTKVLFICLTGQDSAQSKEIMLQSSTVFILALPKLSACRGRILQDTDSRD